MKEQPNNEVLTETEAAKFLRISPRKLFDLRKAGAVPFKDVGKTPRYERQALLAFLRGEWQNGDNLAEA